TKNPNYWQQGLPYLDEVELRPILETQSRENSLKAGTIDAMHSSDVQTVKDLKGNKSIAQITDQNVKGEGEEHFIMLNTAKAAHRPTSSWRQPTSATTCRMGR